MSDEIKYGCMAGAGCTLMILGAYVFDSTYAKWTGFVTVSIGFALAVNGFTAKGAK